MDKHFQIHFSHGMSEEAAEEWRKKAELDSLGSRFRQFQSRLPASPRPSLARM